MKVMVFLKDSLRESFFIVTKHIEEIYDFMIK